MSSVVGIDKGSSGDRVTDTASVAAEILGRAGTHHSSKSNTAG
jgi:hypothetical protein